MYLVDWFCETALHRNLICPISHNVLLVMRKHMVEIVFKYQLVVIYLYIWVIVRPTVLYIKLLSYMYM